MSQREGKRGLYIICVHTRYTLEYERAKRKGVRALKFGSRCVLHLEPLVPVGHKLYEFYKINVGMLETRL